MLTSKDRWLAALHMRPADRLPFWPKLDEAYRRAQAAPYRDMSLDDLHAWIGSDRPGWRNSFAVVQRRATGFDVTTQGGDTRFVYRTPHGELTRVDHFDEAAQAGHPVEFPVKTRDDIAILTEWYADQTVEADADLREQARASYEDPARELALGVPLATTGLMDFVQLLAGVENCHLFLNDYREEVEALFDAMNRVVVRMMEIEAAAGFGDFYMLVENTSTTLISPDQFRRYCLPTMRACAEIAENAQRRLMLHMCGHLKGLLPDLAAVPACAFEAFTSPPVGSTWLLDGRTACPDTCLIGGTNAVQWTLSAEEIIAQLQRDLDALPHHRGIVVTSSGIMPPRCRPETIKAVREWVHAYPARWA